MTYLMITGVAFYLAGVFLERRMDAKGIAMLSAEQVEMLRTHFVRLRKRNSTANLVLAIAYLVALFITRISPYILIAAYVVIYLSVFFVAASVYTRGLKTLNFPRAFIRNFISAKFIRVLAFATFVTTVVSAVKNMGE